MKEFGRKTIGICTPCLNEEESILSCLEAVRNLFSGPLKHYNYQHLISDNGSSDRTVDILRKEATHDKNLRIILNSRNFGFGNSLMNAIRSVEGDAVLLFLPADLQDPPSMLPAFIKKWEDGFQVVSGVRQRRHESFFMRGLRWFHYWIIQKFSNLDFQIGAGEFQLVDRIVVDALGKFHDYDPYIRGMIPLCGYRRTSISYEWMPRLRGKTTTYWRYLYDFNMNGLVYLTKAPVRISALVGVFLIGISFLASLAVLLKETSDGWVWTSLLMTFLSGLNLLFLGIVGEYVLATHSQVRAKPSVLELERLNFSSDDRAKPKPKEMVL